MHSRVINTVSAMAVTVFMVGQAGAATLADSYTSFWALGDSLSDNGNLSYLAYGVGTDWNYSDQTGTNAYYEGRFTNGPSWAEYVAEDFKAAGQANGNLAYGGAEALEDDTWWDLTPGLDYQRKALIDDHASDFGDNPLVSIMIGANDLMGAMGDANIIDIAVDAANKIASTARTLAQNGVGDFLIANMPNLSTIPRYAMFQTSLQNTALAASEAFNRQLANNITDLRREGMQVATLDLWSILGDLQASPEAYGLTDGMRPCLYPNADAAAAYGEPETCAEADALSRLFFDSVHPSARVHEAFGDAVREALAPAPVPLPGTLPLMLGGALVFGLVRRKRKLA